MPHLQVQIVRFVDPGFPGWVEASCVDAEGHVHTILEKAAVLTSEMLDADSNYPQPGVLACVVLGRSVDSKGRETARISPCAVETTAGLTEFTVFSADLMED